MTTSQEAAEALPVSEGDTPPEGQVQGMAAPDDLDEGDGKEESDA
ncbi:hypothetical protein [Streptomyces nigrescens]